MLGTMDPTQLRIRSRIRQLASGEEEEVDLRGLSEESSPSWLAEIGGRIASYVKPEERRGAKQKLSKAGFYHPSAVTYFYVAKVAVAACLPSTMIPVWLTEMLSTNLVVLIAALLAVLGYMMPNIWLDRAIQKNHSVLRKSLPDLLDVTVVCLEAGLSLQESLTRAGEELLPAHPVLALEMSLVQRDIQLGTSIEQALKRFADRCDYEGVSTLTALIREATKFGTNIVEALRSHGDMLRQQRELAAEENAQKAAVKILMPTLLLIFPAIFVVLVAPAFLQIIEAYAAR